MDATTRGDTSIRPRPAVRVSTPAVFSLLVTSLPAGRETVVWYSRRLPDSRASAERDPGGECLVCRCGPAVCGSFSGLQTQNHVPEMRPVRQGPDGGQQRQPFEGADRKS